MSLEKDRAALLIGKEVIHIFFYAFQSGYFKDLHSSSNGNKFDDTGCIKYLSGIIFVMLFCMSMALALECIENIEEHNSFKMQSYLSLCCGSA